MAKIYKSAIEVRAYELDSYGHVNHAVYVRVLEIETRVIESRRVGFTLEQKMFRQGTPLLEAKVTSVIVNESGRPTEIPEEMMQAWKNS